MFQVVGVKCYLCQCLGTQVFPIPPLTDHCKIGLQHCHALASNTRRPARALLVEMLQHLWASGSSQTLDYKACKFIPSASKECQQKKSIIYRSTGLIQVICERVVVLVVCDQPLESSVHHCTYDTEVPMALVAPLLPDNNDIQFRGKAGQTLNKGGHILGEVGNIPTVTILSLGQSVD